MHTNCATGFEVVGLTVGFIVGLIVGFRVVSLTVVGFLVVGLLVVGLGVVCLPVVGRIVVIGRHTTLKAHLPVNALNVVVEGHK